MRPKETPERHKIDRGGMGSKSSPKFKPRPDPFQRAGDLASEALAELMRLTQRAA